MIYTGQLARRVAPWMLGGWVLTWALTIWLPCCEAIAGTELRRHDQAATSHSDLGPLHAHAHGQGNSYAGRDLSSQGSKQEHCSAPNLDGLELYAVLLSVDMEPVEGKVQHILPASTIALNPAVSRQLRWFAHLKHPLPLLPRLYLRTERLRI